MPIANCCNISITLYLYRLQHTLVLTVKKKNSGKIMTKAKLASYYHTKEWEVCWTPNGHSAHCFGLSTNALSPRSRCTSIYRVSQK